MFAYSKMLSSMIKNSVVDKQNIIKVHITVTRAGQDDKDAVVRVKRDEK